MSEELHDELVPRPALGRFVRMMEEALRFHDEDRGTAGWRSEPDSWLMARAREEVDELENAIMDAGRARPRTPDEELELCERIAREAADAANLLMMVADNWLERVEPEPAIEE